jgi:hypothetical protein
VAEPEGSDGVKSDFIHIPPAPTPDAIREHAARALVEDFHRTDPAALPELVAMAIQRETRESWRKQFMRSDPMRCRELSLAIWRLFQPEPSPAGRPAAGWTGVGR